MGKISQYENSVLYLLVNFPATRSDDKLLYYKLLREEGFSTNLTLENFLIGSGCKYPNYDSVTRCRRKLQERFPELRADAVTQNKRDEAEVDFQRYARGEE